MTGGAASLHATGAAFGTVIGDAGTQTVVSAQLAANAATDLRRATGGDV
jgi:hypothetical protein